eukprot:2726204-Rhodomonas_salina.3
MRAMVITELTFHFEMSKLKPIPYKAPLNKSLMSVTRPVHHESMSEHAGSEALQPANLHGETLFLKLPESLEVPSVYFVPVHWPFTASGSIRRRRNIVASSLRWEFHHVLPLLSLETMPDARIDQKNGTRQARKHPTKASTLKEDPVESCNMLSIPVTPLTFQDTTF